MERRLPAGLTDAQRIVLLQFFAGHISAGQLTQRLGLEPPEAAHNSASERQSGVNEPLPEPPQLLPEPPRERAALNSLSPRSWLASAARLTMNTVWRGPELKPKA